ncbi:MAG: hypothetical protein AAFN08_07730 [Cyanobacteria bacterium J06559_3]
MHVITGDFVVNGQSFGPLSYYATATDEYHLDSSGTLWRLFVDCDPILPAPENYIWLDGECPMEEWLEEVAKQLNKQRAQLPQ